MADIITYPENGITYDADDASGYLSTRLSGVYSADEDFAVTANSDLTVTVSAGQAWVRPARFRGRSIIMEQPETLTLTAADSTRTRIDRVVLRYDAAAKKTSLTVLTGTSDSASPTAPEITRTALVYDLCLADIRRPAGSTVVTAADITDTRADEDVCGVMRDGVTGIPTAQLVEQAKAKVAGLEETATASAQAAEQSAAAAAKNQREAASSASTATTQAQAAARSATAASTSQSAAAGSASTASGKAQEAASSADAAARDKTATANSASAAAVSAKAAAQSAAEAKAAASTDKTLTMDGAPADAKATGDALAQRYTKDQADAKFGAPYTLPTATAYRLGGVKVGDGLSVYSDGTLSVTGSAYTLPAATVSTLGGVKVGSGLSVTTDGTLSADAQEYSLPIASYYTLGGIRIGSNLSMDSYGRVSAPDPYTLPAATTSTRGGVIAGSNLTVYADGTLALEKSGVTGALGYTPAQVTAGTYDLTAGSSYLATGALYVQYATGTSDEAVDDTDIHMPEDESAQDGEPAEADEEVQA